MTSFKRWFGAGAIVVVALVLIACPGLVPKVTNEIPDMQFSVADLAAGKAKTITLANHFDVDRDPQYDPKSADPAVATATEADGILTVTPIASGTTNVTVTASKGGNDPISQAFSVTIAEPEPTPPTPPTPPTLPNYPPVIRTYIPDMPIEIGKAKMLTLSESYLDAESDSLSYTATSSDESVAMISGPDANSVITITAVAVGSATITVSATDRGVNIPTADQSFKVTVTATPPEPPDNRGPVLLTSNLIANVAATDFRVGATIMYTLSEHFQDPDNDMLTYEAMSSDSSVASVTEPDAAGMFTLTAEGVSGDTSTSITVKASDPYGASAQQTFTVGVGSNPPMTNSASTDVDLVLKEGMNSRALDLDDYFEDDFDTVLMYVLVSNDGEMYATAVVDGSMLTITAVAVGSATVTVSAQDSDNDPVRQTFNVMVTAGPVTPTPNLAPTSTTIGDMSLMDGETDDLDLSMYFTDPEGDPLTYAAMSDNDAIAMASTPNGSMTTITAVSAGKAMITVTADDGTNDAVSEMFYVTVTEAPNMAPRYKAGKALGNLRIELDLGGHTDNQAIDLSEYFEDPDGILLFFKVVTNDEEVINVHSVAAMDADAASGSLDGTDDDDTMLIVEPLKAGTATVTVTVLDNDQASEDFSFMVTVTAEDTNEEPVPAPGLNFPGTDSADENFGAFVGLDDAGRFKSTDTMSKTLKLDLGLLFNDEDNEANSRTSGDSWTFEAMSTDTDVVTVMVQRTGTGDEHNVVITPVGSGDAMIWFKVTDSFGKSAGTMMAGPAFPVMVNSPPMPYSGEGDDRKSLSTEMAYRNLVAGFTETSSAPLVDNPATADEAEGYFSDKDGDTLLCRLVSQTGESATIDIGARNAFQLTGVEAKTGSSTFTIRCFDQADGEDFESADDTLTVTVDYLQSLQ